MDVTGQWYYARWLGGGCRLDTGAEWNAEIGGKGIIFSEGKLKIPLQYSIDGWWEGPPDSGLRICRRKSYLILQRRKDNKGRFKEVRATSSLCRSACLCYMSTFRSTMVTPGKATVPSQGEPSASFDLSVEATEYIPEPQCPLEELCESCSPEVSSAAEPKEAQPELSSVQKMLLKQERQLEPDSVQDSYSTQTSREWPEPEAEGLPEQPSTAQYAAHISPGMPHLHKISSSRLCAAQYAAHISSEMPSVDFPETTCDEKLEKPPQMLTSFLGVTSLGHSPGATANVHPLGEPARTCRTPLREEIETLGTALETDYPVDRVASEPLDAYPGFIEEHRVPTTIVVPDGDLEAIQGHKSLKDLCLTPPTERVVADVEEHKVPTSIIVQRGDLDDLVLSATSDLSPRLPTERVVADVEDLSTTIYGLFTVPEHAELPDVPCPAEPSRSDSCLLHGGTAFSDGSSDTWLREENDIPQEVSILQREPAIFSSGRQEEMRRFMNANVKPPGDEEEPEEEDPRLRPNPLMRSNKVSGSLSRSS